MTKHKTTTMHDIFEQDLKGPQHENDGDCKAPEMSMKIWDILTTTPGAKDMCIVTSCVNTVVHAYMDRLEKRGVSPQDFMDVLGKSLELQLHHLRLFSSRLACSC